MERVSVLFKGFLTPYSYWPAGHRHHECYARFSQTTGQSLPVALRDRYGSRVIVIPPDHSVADPAAWSEAGCTGLEPDGVYVAEL
jgi:hypothetical protein